MNLWSLSWPRDFLGGIGKEDFYNLLSGFPRPPEAESKYANTIEFLEWFDENIWQPPRNQQPPTLNPDHLFHSG